MDASLQEHCECVLAGELWMLACRRTVDTSLLKKLLMLACMRTVNAKKTVDDSMQVKLWMLAGNCGC